jgi:leader peptidase (prepilin peptidase) / N-methyltransferase
MRFDLPLVFLIPYLFAVGAVIGSFLNVCIYRLPLHDRLWDQLRGITSPPSHCPRCKKRLLRKDNLPVFGWLMLGGRCRFCRLRISPRYPLIEAANGLLFVLVFFCEVPTNWHATIADSCLFSPMGPQGDAASNLFSPIMICFWRWLYHMVLIESLVVATFIDFDLRIIPDGATLPAMAVGVLGGLLLGCVYIVPVWFQDINVLDAVASISSTRMRTLIPSSPVPHWIAVYPHLHGLAVSLAGLVVGGGSIWIVRIIGHFVIKREAMGFGDVVLMATIGSFLGWQPTIVVFFIAPVCALIVVAAMLVFRREREIPYGPYLSLATLIVIVGWRYIWPSAERVFALGLFVPAMGVVMCVLLFLTLQVMQWTKRLLGIPDYEDEEPAEIWQSGDQLFHFAGDNTDGQRTNWHRPQWPGVTAGRGSLFEQQWRNGHSTGHRLPTGRQDFKK